MSDSSLSAENSLPAGLQSGGHDYQLSDDLARLCLPQEFSDECRTLGWVNSICALFLAIGLVGLKAPRVIHKPLSEISEPVPVVFTPPEEQPKPVVEEKQEEPDQTQQTEADTPQVITVVAPANANVAFAVPVQGAVAVATEARLATPPPIVTTHAASKPQQFLPSTAGDGGSYPEPNYPLTAMRNQYQGTVTIEIMVDPSGAITDAKVFKSSGYSVLDDAALNVVKNRWRFPPGGNRWLHWPCIFKLQ